VVAVGITLQPDRRYLDLLAPLFADDADYFEVAPETLWRADPDGQLRPNGFYQEFLALARRTAKPVVAHGVGLSLGTLDPRDRRRQQLWLDRIARDHDDFCFAWYTDHFGATALAGRAVELPIAVPMVAAVAVAMRTRLLELQRIVADVGFENSVLYFTLGDWLDEPAFFSEVLSRPRMHLLLDLHNAYTAAVNLGLDADGYLDRIDTERVIEIHLSGGSRSDPAWFPDGRSWRLDSHDHAIPEAVWQTFARVAPRCGNLRGVTIERMEGTVEEADVELLRGELRRAREVLNAGS